MPFDSDFETWKLAVARASAYVQSNAGFQIQIFGFYMSAVVIGLGLVQSDGTNKWVMLSFVFPALSFFVLVSSCFFFNRLTTQHVFIRLFGHQFNLNGEIKSADHLWSELKKRRQFISMFDSIVYLLRSDYTGPYPIFFLMYNLVGISSASYELYQWYKLPSPITMIFSDHQFIFGICYLFIVISISFYITALMTQRAWWAIYYEEHYIPALPPSR